MALTKVADPTVAAPPLQSHRQSPSIVLGATSLIGRFLIDRLVAAGIETIAISRHAQAPRTGVKWVRSDLTLLSLPQDERPRIAFSASPIWLLARALPLMRQAGVVRLVAFSSTSRYTKVTSRIGSEREVVRLLVDGERDVMASSEELGITWTILRPTVIYAEGQDRSITRLANLVRRFGVLPLPGNARGRRQPVHADDLAAGALAAAMAPATNNRAYDVPGGETLSYYSMSERIFEGMGRRPRIVSVPPVAWRLGVSFATLMMRGINAEMGSRMAENMVFDSTPAERDFHWRPRRFRPHFPTEESVRRRS